ncbi:TBCC domain-containing protein 1 [Oopsacas minuta]|uniref:TBCC domain-containing protein 1 n=1 Tax=Oopsacas minuta TaxID=111878 RepID=A0AAV7JA97_9METZ|nr:TBCC domain-containing protein 1 [Oopsacas minuta]
MQRVVVWPRYELLTPLILHKPPSGLLCSRLTHPHLIKFSAYIRAKTKSTRPLLNYTIWLHVATSKLSMDEETAWLYIDCYEAAREVTREERAEQQQRLASLQSGEELIEYRKDVCVDALSFILYLYTQNAPYSGRTFVPDTGWPEQSPREGTRFDEEYQFLNFIRTGVKDILQLISEVPARDNESQITIECIDCLDLVLSCSLDGRVVSIRELLLSSSLRHDCDFSNNTFSVKTLSSWLLQHLSISPYGVSSIMNGHRDHTNYYYRSSHRGRVCGNYSIAPLGHQITVLDQVPIQTILLEARDTQISYAFIRKCRDTNISLLTPHRTVVIERCYECDICLAPVDSCLVIKKCENVTVRCFARKVVLFSLKGCKLYINTPTQPVFLYNNSNVQLSPANLHYPAIEKQLTTYPMCGINLWDYPTLLSTDTSQIGATPYKLIDPISFSVHLTPFSNPGKLSLPYPLPRNFREALADQKNGMKEWHELEGTLNSSEELVLKQALDEGFNEYLSTEKLSQNIQQVFAIIDKHSSDHS